MSREIDTGSGQGVHRTASMYYARALLDYLSERGLLSCLPIELLAEIEQSPGSARINLDVLTALFERGIAATGEPSLPLLIGENIQLRHLGVMGYIMQTSESVADIIQAQLRYEKIVNDARMTVVEYHGDTIEAYWIPLVDKRADIYMQLSFATWISAVNQLAGTQLKPLEAHFSYPEPEDTAVYRRIFGDTLLFAQAHNKLRIPAHYAGLKIVHSDAEMHQNFLAKADELMQQLDDRGDDFLRQLQRQLSKGLTSGNRSLEAVAEQLQMAPRTVQYKLQLSGYSYRELLDEVRLSLAKNYLQSEDISLAEVAYLLGYGEQSSFQRAFRRWTGQTPKQFRDARNAE